MNKHVYTQEQLDKMSDCELNKVTAEKLGWTAKHSMGDLISCSKKDGETEYFNFLNDYNDCMPIAERFGLSIYQLEDYPNTWFAGKPLVTDCYNTLFPNHISEQPTIQRAIVYCFLMMEV